MNVEQDEVSKDSDGGETVFIGDIHGHAAALEAMLKTLGWKQQDGRWRGPANTRLVFVGELIDHGPDNRRAVELVRDLVERDLATCVLGNHKTNAIQFHTPDPENPGKHLRPQSDKNFRQHEAFLNEYGNDPAGLKDTLAWFRTLPMAVETPRWRCVHACWHPDPLNHLHHENGTWRMPEDRWLHTARAGQPERQAIDVLLNGPEIDLPNGAFYHDKDGHQRDNARLKWWARHPSSLGEAILMPGRADGLDLDQPFDGAAYPGYPAGATPVFFGHYWRTGTPSPELPNAACIDHSAARGGRLVAYRLGRERRLDPSRFVSQLVGNVSGKAAN